MSVIFTNQVPPGGWQFIEPTTKVNLVAQNRDELILNIRDHRRNNGVAPGDHAQVSREIDDQVIAKYPDWRRLNHSVMS